MQKTILQEFKSYSVQKTARKNAKYPRNETILKIGHVVKAIAFAKWSVWVKNLKLSHFSNIWCFFERFFAQNNSYNLVRWFFASFWHFNF